MFTGIIEQIGKVVDLRREEGNLHIEVESNLTPELKIDQSVAHNGVCLTVVAKTDQHYTVTAIAETLAKTNLDHLKSGDKINLERCMQMNARLDGHIVQGHVDQVAQVVNKSYNQGSWIFTFAYDAKTGHVTVEKGSICVNGVSLTVVDSQEGKFSVHIIPYTYEFTNFNQLEPGDWVNLEFDIIGKYVARLLHRG